MDTKIFCGLCGHATESALFEHLREAHQITPADYAVQCPNAPLFTPAFQEYVQAQGLHVVAGSATADGELHELRELFGVKVSCALAPQPNVPTTDEAYHFDPALARSVTQSLVDNDRILLVGPTGAGKSSLVMQLAARLNWPLSRANLHGETSASDFLGQNKVRDGEVYFEYGLLPQAMKNGSILVLEELDGADPGILFVIQGVLEEGGTLTLTDNGGEVIVPHPRFRLVATANTLGTGDESGLYAGTQVLNASHLDRWSVVYQVDYLPESEELKLVAAKAPMLAHTLADAVVKLAAAVRKAIAEEQLYITFSTRRVLAFARKIPVLGLDRALEATILNKLAKTDRAIVRELAQRHLPNLEPVAAA
jgi:cobaltochelatase CobS